MKISKKTLDKIMTELWGPPLSEERKAELDAWIKDFEKKNPGVTVLIAGEQEYFLDAEGRVLPRGTVLLDISQKKRRRRPMLNHSGAEKNPVNRKCGGRKC